MQKAPLIAVFLALFSAAGMSHSQTLLTPNGYSGIGLIPSAQTVKSGTAVLDHTTAIPGATNYTGHNNQIGLGLSDNLELIGRLATQDLHCNMFISTCRSGKMRDLSSSFKFSFPFDLLERNGISVAVGTSDVGGAATYFRSEYFVGTKRVGKFDITLGTARSKSPTSILGDEVFGGVTWSPTDWAKLSVQGIGSESSVHAVLMSPPSENGITASVTMNRRLTDKLRTPEEWFGFSLAIPLDGVRPSGAKPSKSEGKIVKRIAPEGLVAEFEKAGFYDPALGKTKDGSLAFQIDSTSYQWNALDAAGVAVGLIAGAYGDKPQPFHLTITTKGIAQIVVTGDAACVKRWLQNDGICETLRVQSALSRKTKNEDIAWDRAPAIWSLRPEFVVSPVVISGVGTEFGAFDLDVGLNANAVLPLWKGANWEVNRVEPLGFNTQDFERGYPFYASRIQQAVSRRMFHQVASVPMLNSQARLSAGLINNRWTGQQIETQTYSDDGRHRLSLVGGDFKDRVRPTRQRDYYLYSYRYALDAAQRFSSEATYGKFWNGDTGYQVNQRFWYGDTNLNIYVRRTKAADGDPYISFAGLQISLPITPRRNTGARYASVRGINQWTYTLETRILEDTNPAGGGYGEVPNVGENLQRIFNRDRIGNDYLQAETWRLKEAFLSLTN